jgi:hypothetical protein
MKLLGDMGHVESLLVRLEKVLVSVQDTIGSKIILNAPNGNPR